MTKMIGSCGIICTECPGYLATQNDNDTERAAVAKQWAMIYNAEIKPADINCDGCYSDGSRLFSHCISCGIRKCAQEKQMENCAHCEEYACEKLDSFLKLVPAAKTVLDKIKREL